jgi:NADH-quinone oxidoreductase subunit C
MTDDPKNPQPDAGQSSEPEGEETPRAPHVPTSQQEENSTQQAAPVEPTVPAAEDRPPTPESQAALTGKAPSGSSSSGTTMPAVPASETPEEKKARLARVIAEAKARKESAAHAEGQTGTSPQPPGGQSPAVGDPLREPTPAEQERAARIAEARARAAALKETAASKSPPTSESDAAPAATTRAPAATTATSGAGAPRPPVKKKEEGPKPSDASAHPLVQRLRERFPEAVLEATTFLNQLSIRIAPSSIVEVCRALRDDTQTPFNFLCDLTCVHWPEREGEQFEVVYNLYSIPKNERVRLKVRVEASVGVESVTSVWPAANWMEREVFDLFGVAFRNHPDLRRLFLPEDWQGHPLRKDYPLEAMENEWTAKHLPEFTEVQREQLEQRRAYGLELLSTPDERRLREIFRAGREPMPLERK